MAAMVTRRKSNPTSVVHFGSFGIVACLAWTLIGCADPIEPPPSLYEDMALAAQVAGADGIDGAATRFQAYVHGREVHYWTVAGGTEMAMPLYLLCRPEGDEECVPIDHPPIVDRLPGEDGYSAYGQVHWVQLPAGWSGQFSSFDEVHAYIEANDLPMPDSSSQFVHCPIVGEDAALEVAPDTTRTAEATIHVRGMEARCFDFTATRENRSVLPNGEMFVRHVYVLTREGETDPLVEAMRMVDLNGDGDQVDSNNIFGAGLEDQDYTPLWKMVRVTVPAGSASIDSTPEYTAADDMFDITPDYTITPRTDRIVDYEITDTLINCPLQSAEGDL